MNSSLTSGYEDAAAWARQAESEENWQLSADRWRVVYKAYPTQHDALVRLISSIRKSGKIDQAEALIQDFLSHSENDISILEELAEVQLSQHKRQEALRTFDLILEKSPNYVHAWVRKADVVYETGEIQAAHALNSKACSLFPDERWPMIQRAEFEMKEGHWQAALVQWDKVIRKFPDMYFAYQRAAIAANENGDPKQGRRILLSFEYGLDWLDSLTDEMSAVSTSASAKSATDEKTIDIKTINPPVRRSFWVFLDLIHTKSRLNLKSEANRNHLRYLWWVLDPLIYMSVFYVVIGLLLHRGGSGYLTFLLTGLAPYQWFAKSLQYSAPSILNGQGLMNQVKISPLFFPLVDIAQNAGKQVLVFLVLMIFLSFSGLPPNIYWLALIPVILVQLLFMTVLCSMLALIIPFMKDVLNLIPTMIQLLLWCSGILFRPETVPAKWQGLFFTNPIAMLIQQYREVFLYHHWPNWTGLAQISLESIVVIGLLALFYRKYESVYPRVVKQ